MMLFAGVDYLNASDRRRATGPEKKKPSRGGRGEGEARPERVILPHGLAHAAPALGARPLRFAW